MFNQNPSYGLLLYNYHRYYDPDTGRYMTSDPIGVDGGLNTYGYADQNPVAFVDAFGLRATEKAPDPLDMKKKFPSVEDVLCFCVDIYDSFREDRIKQENDNYYETADAIKKDCDTSYHNCIHSSDVYGCVTESRIACREREKKENRRHEKALDDIRNKRYPDVSSGFSEACDKLP